jgi:3D-(3,5/4)-trihydroxycyclohexane-1,2-dione acylhydrolase (decyclizing)
MATTTHSMTVTDAIVEYLIAQRTTVDGVEVPLFPGVFAIFGHGNVTCLGHSLEQRRDRITTWRGQNEQGMALAGIAYAKAMRRRQIMVATSSVGPGATNMITAAGVAMANRLPLLLLAGDTFQSRIPDPVLQQVEHEGSPSTTVNDAFRSVTRFWDRTSIQRKSSVHFPTRCRRCSTPQRAVLCSLPCRKTFRRWLLTIPHRCLSRWCTN